MLQTTPIVSSPTPDLELTMHATGAVEIWLNRPDRMNALGVDLTAALPAVIENALVAGATAIFLRARGRSFCAGADLKERRGMTENERYQHNRAINVAANSLASVPLPTIAVINGAAMGGGLELALCCDIRIAAESAEIGLTESRIGAIPGAGGTQRLPRLIGVSQALYMMYAGSTVSGRRARELGLVNDCVADSELESTVNAYMDLLGTRSPSAMRLMKQAVVQGTAVPLVEGLECEHKALKSVFGSADYAEGLAAFAQKRPPKFAR